MHQIELSTDDLRLLLQSLDHCLATCKEKSQHGPDAPCTDCDAARRLRARLASLEQTPEAP